MKKLGSCDLNAKIINKISIYEEKEKLLRINKNNSKLRFCLDLAWKTNLQCKEQLIKCESFILKLTNGKIQIFIDLLGFVNSKYANSNILEIFCIIFYSPQSPVIPSCMRICLLFWCVNKIVLDSNEKIFAEWSDSFILLPNNLSYSQICFIEKKMINYQLGKLKSNPIDYLTLLAENYCWLNWLYD